MSNQSLLPSFRTTFLASYVVVTGPEGLPRGMDGTTMI
jgi:hypothetical protein